ncbi:Na/Pi cotransporter family protein [Rossellomorea vietnamensis]|uniref:Na/Pi cotransporter family protein n=1 Tax=Rossellomorea vietnamensis TaxID=218284 RepID=A0A5D4P1E5_9BACI|nr:Na/Pi symporter [Rossellomorea vietnamensis]TYS19516.1 Na/Pi cotransporter family protein [Rossellomorea vietnamensis]
MLSLLIFFLLIGSFLLGMFWLKSGLYNLAGERMTKLISKWTDAPWKGFLIGIAVTGVLQSSSAVMVLTIGFVSAGILSFRQSIGIILGTNIGTTLTLEIISLDIGFLSLPLLGCSLLLLILPYPSTRALALTFLGLSLIFVSMNGFEELARPLSSQAFIHSLMERSNASALFSVLLGTILTGLVQSSTVITGIAMSFVDADIITIFAGISIMLGANIGTCVTSYIAGIGSGKATKLTVYAHIWLNVAGVMIFFPFIEELGEMVKWASANPELQLAHASLAFNVICSVLVLPFSGHFASLIEKFHANELR